MKHANWFCDDSHEWHYTIEPYHLSSGWLFFEYLLLASLPPAPHSLPCLLHSGFGERESLVACLHSAG
jgi:hypothetical protein